MKLWNGLPIAAHSAELAVVVRFAWIPTRTSKGEIVWLERLRWTLHRHDWTCYTWGGSGVTWKTANIERVSLAAVEREIGDHLRDATKKVEGGSDAHR